MRAVQRLALVVSASVALAGAAPAWVARAVAPAQAPAPALVDLRDPAELRARFNADRGLPRLVLLLSPT